MKKKISKILALAMGATLLIGCGGTKDNAAQSESTTMVEGKQGEKEIIKAMCVGTEADTYLEDYQSIVDDFNANNKYGVTVEMEFYENEQYKTKLTTLMASNAIPDIFFTWELSYLEPFVSGGKVADITSYLDADKEWKDSFADGTLELLSYDEKVYAVPTQKSLCVMFYNKQIFEENGVKVPTTYEEFLVACETFKTAGVTPMSMCGTDAWIPAQFAQQISNGIAGMDLYNGIKEGEKKWNDAPHVEAAKEIQQMANAGYFQDGYIGMGPEESTDLFMNGKTAMYFQGAWDCGKISASEMGNVAGAFSLPAKNSEYNNISVGSVDTSFAVAESSKNKDAAVAFLKHWTSVESEERLLYNEGRMPGAVFDIENEKLHPLFAEILEVSNQQVGLTPWWDRAFGAGEGVEFNNTCVSICGGEEPQKAFDGLQQFAEDNADR